MIPLYIYWGDRDLSKPRASGDVPSTNSSRVEVCK